MVPGSQENTSSHGEPTLTGSTVPFAADEHLIQPGLEVAPASEEHKHYVSNHDEGAKEVINQGEKEVVGYGNNALEQADTHEPARSRSVCGMRRKLFFALLIVVLVLIALGVGLGVGLAIRNSDEPSPSSTTSEQPYSTSTQSSGPSPTAEENDLLTIGSTIDPDFASDAGAWNGSGIARTWQNFAQDWPDTPQDTEHSVVLYYQGSNSEIRWLRRTTNASKVWQPGPTNSPELSVVASNARKSTPISVVNYDADQVSYWHVFYIGSDNRIRHRSGNNGTDSSGWNTEESILTANLTAWNGDLVGLSACASSIGPDIPIRLFFASNKTTFQEYLYWAEKDEWEWKRQWDNYNGAAGVGCWYGQNTDWTYVGLIQPGNQLQLCFQSKTEDGSSAEWLPGEPIEGVQSASSLAFNNEYAVWQQSATNNIIVSRMNWDARNTYVAEDLSPGDDYAGVSGTRLATLELWGELFVFYQHLGNDVRWIKRGTGSDGVWDWRRPV